MEFLEKKIYVSPAPRKYLWLVGNQLPHLQTTDQKNRENPTTQSNIPPTICRVVVNNEQHSLIKRWVGCTHKNGSYIKLDKKKQCCYTEVTDCTKIIEVMSAKQKCGGLYPLIYPLSYPLIYERKACSRIWPVEETCDWETTNRWNQNRKIQWMIEARM